MRTMLTLLIVLMISLSLNGCADKIPVEPVVQVKHVYHYTPCAKDNPPTYIQLNPEKHIGSSENVNTLIGNVEIMKDYTQSLINTIGCYEAQVEKKDESN